MTWKNLVFLNPKKIENVATMTNKTHLVLTVVILICLIKFSLTFGPAIHNYIGDLRSDEYYYNQGFQVREHMFPVRDLGYNICYYHNYKNASAPTSSAVYSFLVSDNTDKIQYHENNFSCINYAIAVHDNAEKNGLKCEIVIFNNKPFHDLAIKFANKLLGKNKPIGGHAINVFNTTDKGKIYVDCTQHKGNQKNNDYIGKVSNGYYHISPISLDMKYNNTNSYVMKNIGVIEKIEIYS